LSELRKRSDFAEYFWLTSKALFERIANDDKTKGDLPKLVKIFMEFLFSDRMMTQ